MCNLDNLIIFQVYYFHLSISQNTPQESSTLPSKTCVAPNHNHYAKGNAGSPILCPPDARSQLIGKDSDAGKDWWEGDDRGWNGWMASLTQQTWVWASSGRWWRMGSLSCYSPWGHNGSDTTERLNWPNWLTDSHSIPNDPKSYYPPLPDKVTEVQNGFFKKCPNPIA